jgi:hypothetical protein
MPNRSLQRAVRPGDHGRRAQLNRISKARFDRAAQALLLHQALVRRVPCLLLTPLLKMTEYIIRCSMLDVRCWTFISFFSIKLAAFEASGWADA